MIQYSNVRPLPLSLLFFWLVSSLPQRRRWLEEALEAMASAPTETQILQTAITVLRVCEPPGTSDHSMCAYMYTVVP